ncbi:hypothetical protein [Mycobacteroides abscessus]|uniref:hypothetical protein n=1 Tax=Mycobacteroides abscessus TaxID=36809 RepID=UPI000C26B734|nr:hypothetical protein [Mycobacteroides abscessus]
MGHYVTIEGSLTPTDVLDRGVRRTVAVTDEIRNLVKIGGAIVVVGSLDEPDVVGDDANSESTLGGEATDGPDAEAEADSSKSEDDTQTATKRARVRKPSATDADETQPRVES